MKICVIKYPQTGLEDSWKILKLGMLYDDLFFEGTLVKEYDGDIYLYINVYLPTKEAKDLIN